MAMITDIEYALQAIRLSALRHSDDPLTPRIISLDPSFALNPYITASGLSDIDRWPEIKRALDSPPPEYPSSYESVRNARYERVTRDRSRDRARSGAPDEERRSRDGGLKYTQTIMGPGRTGGAGMRVSGRLAREGEGRGARAQRANSTEALSPFTMTEKTPVANRQPQLDDGFFSPTKRPRADSAPAPVLLAAPAPLGPSQLGSSISGPGRGLGGSILGGVPPVEQALSISEASADLDEEVDNFLPDIPTEGNDSTDIGRSARPSDIDYDDPSGTGRGGLGETMVDEGSDVDDDELYGDDAPEDGYGAAEEELRTARLHKNDSRRSSMFPVNEDPLDFTPIPIPRVGGPVSALTAALNKHIPHLVSTSQTGTSGDDSADFGTTPNPFASLYTTVAAPPSAPSLTLEIYFPHSDTARVPIMVKVRKDATVEEVTGFGLYTFWEEGRRPFLSEDDGEEKWSTVGWGLRIVEDDGEVDEDFPPLDRDSKISKFSYGQFAIVEATAAQIKQNAAKAPLIQRRPSRIIAQPHSRGVQPGVRPGLTQNPSASSSVHSFSSSENLAQAASSVSAAMRGSVGLSSALGKQVLLRVKITASADVHFTTTLSVPSDMYIADLTEILCKKKRLAMPYTDWVLCLADLTLAIPVDRTVASLEGKTDLALVRAQWAAENGLRIGARRGGDPNASIFKRQSELNPPRLASGAIADFAHTYKKYRVYRKIAIGRHERVLAIDGDYIHIMPSESRAFFDSMKTTSFHISLVASVKLSGRSGGFKINVWREGAQKRYEFEAENGKQANEIVNTIRSLLRSHQAERTSMLPIPRTLPRR